MSINLYFPTDYLSILNRINEIDPIAYSKTRNYLNGKVTYLSPYLSKGAISTKQIMDNVLSKHTLTSAHNLIFELAWREYWQKIWLREGDKIFDDLINTQTEVVNFNIPKNVINGNTTITAIDNSIKLLIKNGYMHNHLRMYVASICTNIAKAHWSSPSRWMYYHLLDGDLASNSLSWQWVAMTFSSKKYYCNQENINKYCSTSDKETFLDKSYEELSNTEVPKILQDNIPFLYTTELPDTHPITVDPNLPLLIYNSYNLDPLWRCDLNANRILLLEPSHFKKFPISDLVLNFILALGENIKGLQLFTGEFSKLIADTKFPIIIAKEHPTANHYKALFDEREWMFPSIEPTGNSFMSFWKKCEQKYLANTFK